MQPGNYFIGVKVQRLEVQQLHKLGRYYNNQTTMLIYALTNRIYGEEVSHGLPWASLERCKQVQGIIYCVTRLDLCVCGLELQPT